MTIERNGLTYEILNEKKVRVIKCDKDISGGVMIPSRISGYTVEEIGEYAFGRCTRVTRVVLPNSATKIANGAFVECTAMESVTIHEGVTEIGASAFSYCKSLKSITVPDKVTVIGDSVFYGCVSLTSITIPDGVTTIGERAFFKCTALKSFNIPDSVTSVSATSFLDTAFYNDESNWDNSRVLYVGNYLIAAKLPIGFSYTVKSGTKIIASKAFYGSTTLKSITVPSSVEGIGEAAMGYYFDNGVKLNGKLSICGEAGSVAEKYAKDNGIKFVDAKENAESFKYVISDNRASVERCNKELCGKVTILSSVRGCAVDSISSNAFENCEKLTGVKIPDTVTSIGSAAFYGCKSLINITLPYKLKTIEERVFFGCSALKEVTIPDGVTSIGDGAFSCCDSLNDTIIPDSVKTIGRIAFFHCIGMKRITVPSSVKSIGEHAIGYCHDGGVRVVKDFVIRGEAGSVAEKYAKDNGIKFDIMTKNLPECIEYSVSNGCVTVTKCDDSASGRLTIPQTIEGCPVVEIGESAFAYCYNLTSIAIPDGIVKLSDYAINGCFGLESINIPKNVKQIGEFAFSDGEKLTEITLPDGLSEVGLCAFLDCPSLTSVTVPDSVKDIGLYAFGYTYDKEGEKFELLNGFTLCGGAGSVAEEYAKNNGITFVKKEAEAKTENVTPSVGAVGKKYEKLTYAFSNNSATVKKCDTLASFRILIPPIIDGYPVTSIGANAFENCRNITNVIIPDSVTSIGTCAFSGCRNLISVTVPASVTSIGAFAFARCQGLSILCYKDSYAEKFAKEKGIRFATL